MSVWNNSIDYVADGELVAASIVNRPDQTLAGNTQYLKDRLDAADLGEALVAYDCTVASGVQVGQPVFYNSSTQQFELALAATAIDSNTNSLTAAASADCVGIVRNLTNATLGDITLAGRDQINLTAATGANPTYGRYYLSSQTAGKLVQQRPSVSVPVCILDSAGYVYINPRTRNFLTDHTHWRYRLTSAPAGTVTPPGSGNQWTINSPDATKKGWLPASHAVFNGAAPANAVYGYNISVDTDLLAIWPPIPVEAAYLLMDTGNDTGATVVSMGQSGLASIDATTIWWYSDRIVPWVETYDSTSPPTEPVHTSPSGNPFPGWFYIDVIFSIAAFETANSVVTSLKPALNSPITVTNASGGNATVGDLQLGLNLGLTVQTGDVTGAEALKGLSNNGFTKGYVVEQLVAGTGITLSATHTSGSNYQGTVTVGLTPTPTDRELLPAAIKLADAEPSFYLDTPYLDLPSDRSSSIRYEFLVAPDGLPTNPTLAIRLLLLGLVSGTLPSLTVTYRRLARPGTGLAVNLPTSSAETSLTITTNSALTASQYIEATSNTFTVAAGDTVLVYVSRSAPDGYSGDVGVLRCGAILQGS